MRDKAESPALVDICEVSVDRSLPQTARIAEFVRQIKDPCHYLCEGVDITAEYSKNGPSLEECLRGLCS